MGERKGTNKYYPPDYNPKRGGLNKFQGTHALRERARKLHLGILIIRFEMPYNIWCSGCENHIGMGVRYNAEKTKVGMYYSTPVYQFRMKCHLCDNHIEMRTDPGNLDYLVISGARRQENRWDPLQNEQVVPEEKATSRRLADDPMFKLEHGTGDQSKAGEQAPRLNRLVEIREERGKDDYTSNCLLRAAFRAQRQQTRSQAEKDKMLLARTSLNIPLVPETDEDRQMAALLALAPAQTVSERFSNAIERIDQRPVLPTGVDSSTLAKRLTGVSALTCADPSLTRNKLGISLKTQARIKKEKIETNCSSDNSKEQGASSSGNVDSNKRASSNLCLVSGDYGSSSSEENSRD